MLVAFRLCCRPGLKCGIVSDVVRCVILFVVMVDVFVLQQVLSFVIVTLGSASVRDIVFQGITSPRRQVCGRCCIGHLDPDRVWGCGLW